MQGVERRGLASGRLRSCIRPLLRPYGRGPWWEGADRRPIRLTSSEALCPRRIVADPGPTGDAITLLVHPRMPRNCLGGRRLSERLAVRHHRPSIAGGDRSMSAGADVRRHRRGDPRRLAGQRHRDNVAGTPLEQPFDPGLMGARSTLSPVQDRARAPRPPPGGRSFGGRIERLLTLDGSGARGDSRRHAC